MNLKRIFAFLLILIFILTGCGRDSGNGTSEEPQQELFAWQQISQQEAQRIMDEEEGFIILDVRTQEEYDEGHIPGAICVPNEAIIDTPPEELPDKDQLILVYCRSGRRSKEASQKLADMGYSDIREFGGINTWPGEVVTGEGDQLTDPSWEGEAVEMKITIQAGEHQVIATLYDNAAGRAFWNMLPITLSMENLYGREMCYRFGAGTLPEDEAADTGYEIGDISYWPPRGSLVILYKQNGEVFQQQPIGHTDDDVSFFNGMPETKITFNRAD